MSAVRPTRTARLARWLALTTGAGLAALVLGLLLTRPRAPVAIAAPAAAGTPAVRPTLAATAPASVTPRAALAPTTLPADRASAIAATGRPPRPGEFDLCGLGRRQGVLVMPDRPFDPQTGASATSEPVAASAPPAYALPAALADDALVAVLPRLQQALAASADVRQQAAALVLADLGYEAPRAERLRQAARLGQLARLAIATADPVVMTWAWRACAWAVPSSACAGLSARHWLQAEPDNLVAWLSLLEKEPAARDEALNGMVHARRADFAVHQLAAVADSAWPPDLPPYLRVALASRILGIEAAQPSLQHVLLFKVCDDTALADANRRQQCAAIAKVLVGHGMDFDSLSMGLGLMGRLDWPAGRRGSIFDEYKTLMTLTTTRTIDPAQPWGCPSVVSTQRWLAGIRQLGELAWWRQQHRAVCAEDPSNPYCASPPPTR